MDLQSIVNAIVMDIKAKDHILLSNYDDVEWRQDRLRKAVTRISSYTCQMIYKLNDHKGTLEVFWKRPFSSLEASEVLRAWEAQNECYVMHYRIGDDNG